MVMTTRPLLALIIVWHRGMISGAVIVKEDNIMDFTQTGVDALVERIKPHGADIRKKADEGNSLCKNIMITYQMLCDRSEAGAFSILEYMMDEYEKEAVSMKCTKCESNNLIVVKSGPHHKLVCANCMAYQKFLSAEDAKTFEQIKQKEQTLHHVGEAEETEFPVHTEEETKALHAGKLNIR